MTDIRVSGQPDLVKGLVDLIKKYVPDIISEKEYNSNTPGEILVYLSVQEPNQVIRGGLQDHQIIEYCYSWRTKAQVAKYFSIEFEAASEILERLTDSGDLLRYLDDSGAKLHHHYEYINSNLVHYCKDCKHSHYIEKGHELICTFNDQQWWCSRYHPVQCEHFDSAEEDPVDMREIMTDTRYASH